MQKLEIITSHFEIYQRPISKDLSHFQAVGTCFSTQTPANRLQTKLARGQRGPVNTKWRSQPTTLWRRRQSLETVGRHRIGLPASFSSITSIASASPVPIPNLVGRSIVESSNIRVINGPIATVSSCFLATRMPTIDKPPR